MTFAEYMELMRLQMVATDETGRMTQPGTPFATLLNQRMMRNLQSYVVSPELKKLVSRIIEPQDWMVLTEPSCGDSSQMIPILARIAECNARIKLDLVLRDQNPQLMDAYLTEGKRSIPKLVCFDRNRKELFRWGPRPKPAQALFEKTLQEGHSKAIALERVHLFYAKDKGKTVEEEFLMLLQGKELD